MFSNRWRARQDMNLHGQTIATGTLVEVNWVAANRDPRQFPNLEQFRWQRDHQHNLLYGAGIHLCPGAPLPRLVLRIVIETLPCPRLTRPAGFANCGSTSLISQVSNFGRNQ